MAVSLCTKGEILKLRYDEFGLYEVRPQLKLEYDKALAKIKEADSLFRNNVQDEEKCTMALKIAVKGVRDFMAYIARDDEGNYALTLARYKRDGIKIYSDIEILIKRFCNLGMGTQTYMGSCLEQEIVSVTDIQFILGLTRITVDYMYKIEMESLK